MIIQITEGNCIGSAGNHTDRRGFMIQTGLQPITQSRLHSVQAEVAFGTNADAIGHEIVLVLEDNRAGHVGAGYNTITAPYTEIIVNIYYTIGTAEGC